LACGSRVILSGTGRTLLAQGLAAVVAAAPALGVRRCGRATGPSL